MLLGCSGAGPRGQWAYGRAVQKSCLGCVGVASAPLGWVYELTGTAGGMPGGALEGDGGTSQGGGRSQESEALWTLLQPLSHQPCAGAENGEQRGGGRGLPAQLGLPVGFWWGGAHWREVVGDQAWRAHG